MKIVTNVLLWFLLLGVMVSCEHTVPSEKEESCSLNWEIETLSSVDELNLLLAKGNENIVDWQLSKEFAEFWLTYGKESGEYPRASSLLPVPIAIYSSDGDIRFYEFRVVDKNKLIGSIVGAATKDYGCPIVFEGKSSGYSIDLKKLYDMGKLTNEDLPRLVDDGYPSVVIGRTTPTKGVSGEFNEYLTLADGSTVNKGDIKEVLTYDKAIEIDPELFKELSDEDRSKMEVEIAKYQKDATLFWQTAETHKGKVLDFQTRGQAKNEETTLETYMNTMKGYKGPRLNNYWLYLNNKKRLGWYKTEYDKGNYVSIYNYGDELINYMHACGLVAAGFVLDYLAANGLAPRWENLNFEKKGKCLKDEMYAKDVVIAGKWKGRMVWPHNLGNSISAWSDYKRTISGCICPEKAINKGLPGISLRLMKPTSWEDFTAGPHYRAVIAYKKPGWGIFKWWEIKILDRVDCKGDEKQKGRWETYIPFYHFASYNIVRK